MKQMLMSVIIDIDAPVAFIGEARMLGQIRSKISHGVVARLVEGIEFYSLGFVLATLKTKDVLWHNRVFSFSTPSCEYKWFKQKER
jgi:hypothetical protein